MGCCNPLLREKAKEQEEQVNRNGKEKLPVAAKIGAVGITIIFVTIMGIILLN
ncbi:hypothetical protein [Calidifontibacillus erzurumensis]|uniref:Uncharacterized protein n=1 Tax=Calidifontibacillus erzurumensis TaxID=2741433 RepID=A0A8J8GDV6_9BACI|nr:hypothetical protein [Calidifontibacillus erzurumensis]NSL51857.1 hypothetical protein [Calidifontibacillus erzurumensis]